MDKKTFIMNTSYAPMIDAMPAEQAGMLIKAVFSYQSGVDADEIISNISDPIVVGTFNMMLIEFEENYRKWKEAKEAKQRAGREAAQKRWGKSDDNKPNNSDGESTEKNIDPIEDFNSDMANDDTRIANDGSPIRADANAKQIVTKMPVNVNVNVNENVSSDEDINTIVEAYNRICVSMPRCVKLTNGRKKHIKARLKEFDVDAIERAFMKAEASDFLSGRSIRSGDHTNWKCNFDWIVGSTEHMTKILEGQYDNRSKPNSPYAEAWINLEEEINAGIGNDNKRGTGS